MSEEAQRAQQDTVWWVKEKQALENQLAEKEKEITTVKSRNYDLLKQVEELTQKLQREGQSNKPQRKVKQKQKRKSTTGEDKATTTDPITISSSSKIVFTTFEDTKQFYKEIAERFPTLTLATVLNAENRFTEADSNNDGTIDLDELEKLLDKSGLLFTKKQVQEILNTIDTDDTGTLDLMECLEVIDRITQNRATKLPQVLTSSSEARSRLCNIQ